MKKFIFAAVAILAIMFTSCTQQIAKDVVTTTTTKTTITEPGTDGFLLSKEVVVKGNTIWGFSQKVYGTGTHWRDIVAQNPFLNQPGRIYYNEAKKMWIVKIFPGEVIKIGNEVIIPSYTVEETTTTTETTNPVGPVIPWWGWLIIAVVLIALIILLLNLFGIYNPLNNSSSSSSSAASSAVYVDIRNGCNIDLATRATLLGREQDFNDRALAILASSAERNELEKFKLDRMDNNLVLSAKFFNHGKVEKPEVKPVEQKTEPVKEEGK